MNADIAPLPSPLPSSLPSPLPSARLLTTAPVGGHIKDSPQDFLVEELPLYEPCGTGEHLYLRIGKTDMPHHELLSILRSHFRVGDKHIGFAGIKDRRAVTSQTVSIHLPGNPETRAIQHDRIQVLWATWHTNKLRRGHLAGNRFSIRIRGVEPFHAPQVWRGLQSLAATGAPNYFGPQRFGNRVNGHVLGRLVLERQWDALVKELLGTEGAPFAEHQRAAREAAQAGKWDVALELWGRNDGAERGVLRALARGATVAAAAKTISPDALGFWVSAWQSAVFNRLLDGRVTAGAVGTLSLGDVAWKHANGAAFIVDEAAVAAAGDESLMARAARFEISATGILPGPGAVKSTHATAQAEREAIAHFGIQPEFFDAPNSRQSGARRPFRIPIGNPEIEGGFDDQGPYVRVAFDLPPGAFATVVLSELGVDTSAQPVN